MPSKFEDLRETDFKFVKRQLHELYRKRRTTGSKSEYQHADTHIHSYQEFLSENDYPEYTEIDDLKS